MNTIDTLRQDNLLPQERVALARSSERPHIYDFVNNLFEDFFEIHGDRHFGDDKSIMCGICRLDGLPVTVAGHIKGANLEENIEHNFGMPNPEGYRKFQRAVLQAEKFNRPVITFIDTPGAYPGAEAEKRGQGEAIAKCLSLLSGLRVPIISVVTGEGGSGGALAMGLADRIIMLENSIYSILSPEGFASILWKDAKRSNEACGVMKLTSYDLLNYKIIDKIIEEPEDGAGKNHKAIYKDIKEAIDHYLKLLSRKNANQLVEERYKRYRTIGNSRACP